MPDKILLKVIQLINKVQSLLPASVGGITSVTKDAYQSFEELRTFMDFAKLLNNRPELKEQVDKIVSSEKTLNKETIEKIASMVFDQKIKEFEVVQEGGQEGDEEDLP